MFDVFHEELLYVYFSYGARLFNIKYNSQFNNHQLILNSRQKKENPFRSSNFIKLATVPERQAPPIHARPRLN